MPSDYVLNRASVKPVFVDADAAGACVAELLRALASLDQRSDELPAFRSYVNPWQVPLVENRRLAMTMGEVATSLYETGDHDVASFFDSLQRMTPIDNEFSNEMLDHALKLEMQGPVDGHETCFEAASAAETDLLVCAVANFVLASLPRDWWRRFDMLAFRALDNDYFVEHVASEDTARAVFGRRVDAVRKSLVSRTLWTEKERAFPNLLFGNDVESQLPKFSAKHFGLLVQRLGQLDDMSRRWATTGKLPKTPLEIRPESRQTMKNYGMQRRFRGYDNVVRVFEKHVWIDEYFRVHLFCHLERRTIEIGYVGPHLGTIKYPT